MSQAHSLTPSKETQHRLARLSADYLSHLRRHERSEAEKLVMDAVAAGTDVRDVYLGIFQPAMYEVGRLWQTNEITVAQEHYITAATQYIISRLYAHIFKGGARYHSLVSCCVDGELHELGIRMVTDFFELEGWDTHYLGASLPHGDVVSFLEQIRPDLLCVSVTMTFNVHKARHLIQSVRRHPSLKHLKILVGGYPFIASPSLVDRLGVDGWATDALGAVAEGTRLMKGVTR